LESVIYLLDTDTVIFLGRGSKSTRPKALREKAVRLADRCKQAQADGHILGLSAITVSELEFGARYGGRYEAEMSLIRGLTAPFERYAYDAVECPDHYGRVRDGLERNGTAIGALDMLIAAHALALDATLVSNNTAHFSRVRGLKVDNWLAT
jgi:tRNA(fMet)-specific endonuclease VapC